MDRGARWTVAHRSWARLKRPGMQCPLSQWCYLTLSASVASFYFSFTLSQYQGIFQWVGPLHQVAKYWSFNFSISPSNEYSGLISFRMDWLDLLAVQGTLNCLLQHHSLKASVLRCSAFFMVQPSQLIVTTGKPIALTRQTFAGKVMSLLFSMLSRFVIALLPRSKRLLISWLQSPSTVILEPKKMKSVTAFTPLLFTMKWWDLIHDLSFLDVEF